MAATTDDRARRTPEIPWMGLFVLVVALGAYAWGQFEEREKLRTITVVVKVDTGNRALTRFTRPVNYSIGITLRGYGGLRHDGRTTNGIIAVLLPKRVAPRDVGVMVNLRTMGDCCMDRDGPATPTKRAGTYEVVLFCFRDCGT